MALRQYSFSFKVMARRKELSIYAKSKEDAQRISSAAIAEVCRLAQRHSRYLHDSQLSRIKDSGSRRGGYWAQTAAAAVLVIPGTPGR